MGHTNSSTYKHGHPFAGSHILVCGASGDLGSALAVELARYGAKLSLWGRRADRLDEVARECRMYSGGVSIRTLDLADIEAAVTALQQEDDAYPFDCAFLVAGIGDTVEAGHKVESTAQLIRHGLINFTAPAALCGKLGERMAGRGHGRIALVGSAAATHPLPFAAGYTASKRGLAHFADAMRIALKPHGVTVTLLAPGFFAGSGKDYGYARPGEISARAVADRAIRAVACGQPVLVTPWWFRALGWLGHVMPRPLRDKVMLSLPRP